MRTGTIFSGVLTFTGVSVTTSVNGDILSIAIGAASVFAAEPVKGET
jgi:hypothetical protein